MIRQLQDDTQRTVNPISWHTQTYSNENMGMQHLSSYVEQNYPLLHRITSGFKFKSYLDFYLSFKYATPLWG